MRKRFILPLVILALLNFGCGEKETADISDQVDQQSDDPTVLAKWDGERSDFVFDFSEGSFGQHFFAEIRRDSGEICECRVLIDGNQTSGDFEVLPCGPKITASDPRLVCEQSGRVGYYEVDADSATLCFQNTNGHDCYRFSQID